MTTTIGQWTQSWAQSKNVDCQYIPVIDSTNNWSKNSFDQTSFMRLYVADQQLAGRGRHSNTWQNPKNNGTTLLSTWCYTLTSTPHPLTNIKIGLALYHALIKTWPTLELSIKAPNDIYILDKKCAGILTEVSSGKSTSLHIGIGINVLDKPVVDDRPVAALADFTNVDIGSWSLFCDTLHTELQMIADTPEHDRLTKNEIALLNIALKKFPGNRIDSLLENGSLKLRDGEIIHWNEL